MGMNLADSFASFASYVAALAALFLLGGAFGWLLGALRERRRWNDDGRIDAASESWWAAHRRLWRERRTARREERRLRDLEPWEAYEDRTRAGWRREAEQQASSPTVIRPAGGGLVMERGDETLFVPPAAGAGDDD